jgi:hypothetical protein
MRIIDKIIVLIQPGEIMAEGPIRAIVPSGLEPGKLRLAITFLNKYGGSSL